MQLPSKTPARFLSDHVAFFPVLFVVLVSWYAYRVLFSFPVWFDETVGKAVFFGFPVWLYVTTTASRAIPDTFAPAKLKPGLLLGIAVGGIFGFVMSLLSLAQRGGVVQAVWLFESPLFWREFLLALLTAFWETLLFFSFAMTVILEKFRSWSMVQQVLLTAVIFLIFHVPNTVLRFDAAGVGGQVFILFLFAVGQAFLFASRRNAYALVLSHAIWGMVLLVHAW
ncbi:hypothetical protein KBC79_05450 [Candidatus Woesebacteria bacterium]|nr:hypothetical protein [Candidatus Woesebacteria bacterium]